MKDQFKHKVKTVYVRPCVVFVPHSWDSEVQQETFRVVKLVDLGPSEYAHLKVGAVVLAQELNDLVASHKQHLRVVIREREKRERIQRS